jgi:hypothetical protein
MKNRFAWGVLAFSAVSLWACSDVDLDSALDPYAEATVTLDPSHATVDSDGTVTMKSSLEFTNLHHFTNYRTECDTVQCGTTTQQQCEPVQTCNDEYQCWPEEVCNPEQVCQPVEHCTGGGQQCHDENVCQQVPNGQQVCHVEHVCHQEPPTCTTSTVCHEENVCHSEQRCGYRPVCHTDTVCHDVQVPVYCQVNCRQVPFPDTVLQHFPSTITVKVKGLGKAKVSDVLKQLVLIAKPNDKFRAAMDDPSQRPKGSDPIFNSVQKSDHTIIVLKAQNFVLSAGQKVLELPSTFKPGDDVEIDLAVEAASAKDAQISAAGTSTDFPPLNTSD